MAHSFLVLFTIRVIMLSFSPLDIQNYVNSGYRLIKVNATISFAVTVEGVGEIFHRTPF